MITSEEFLLHNTVMKDITRTDVKIDACLEVMIKFAKLHVTEALKQAEERCITQADSILNAYPLDNIK